jgi:uncharacterized protein (DUF924 family)
MIVENRQHELEGDADAQRVLDLWFGPLDRNGCASPVKSTTWWKKDEAFDLILRNEFADLHAAVATGEREHWLEDPRGRLAYVIVLDQLSRNMFRGTARMFAQDDRALDAAIGGIERGHDRDLRLDERVFMYMPFMHSESIDHQNRCIELFEKLRDEQGPATRERVARNVDFAVQHRNIVARFGRFPHRNKLLERPSTHEELAFLQGPGSSF